MILSLFKRFHVLFTRLNEYLSIVSALAVVIAMFAILADVTGRLLKTPILGVNELNALLVGMCVYLAIGFVQNKKKNIAVSLLTDRLSKRWASILDVPILGLNAALFGWASYIYYNEAKSSYLIREVAEGISEFPLYPLKFVMFLGLTLLTIQILTDIIIRLFEIVSSSARRLGLEGKVVQDERKEG